jgi:hypothetical protein
VRTAHHVIRFSGAAVLLAALVVTIVGVGS